ncbi:MAG: N-acetylmuramoyl-L-alanine amidase, partial [Oscillospiraceae bacterium]|nr:N-acetylmuramoyl-L-alanine amidase [Oscillospiraceae bacterium]
FSNDFSQAEYLKDGDILKRIFKNFKAEKIQIILALECSTLTEDTVAAAVEELNKKYYPAGILLENYMGSDEMLQNISSSVKDKFKNYYFGIRTDFDHAQQLAADNTMNLFVINSDISNYSGSYIDWKNGAFAEEKVLLNYESASFLNDLFILSNFYEPDGYILTEYTSPDTDLNLYHSMLNTLAPLPKFNLSVDSTFAVTNPSKNISTYADGIFVTGSADPQQPLYINGTEVEKAADGTFGLYIQLEHGENLIEVTQGEETITRMVTRKIYESTGSSTGSKMKFDDTKKAYKGQVVQTINPLTSILSVPDDDSRIKDGLQQGVQMVVADSVKTVRNGKYTWAYELSNGGYVLAKNVEWVDDEDYTPAVVNAYYDEEYLQEDYNILKFALNGKPAIVSAFDYDGIQLTFLDTCMYESFDDDFIEENDVLVLHSDTDSAVQFTAYQDGDNLVINIPNITEEGFWGYNIEYQYAEDWQYTKENSFIEIYLKNPPHKSAGSKPLEGITVMLDAGHGGDDVGALGVGGVKGPNEEDINLAVTLATKECLEKFGATVYLTRSDDTFLTLEQRRALVSELKPDLFISQHHNSLEYTVDATKGAGFESYYFTPQSIAVAEIMASRITDTTGRNNRGFGYGYYYVLRNDIAPSVLNEYGFVVNPYEYAN